VYGAKKTVFKVNRKGKRRTYNSTYQKCGHWASAFAKAVDNLLIFALQMANKHLALLVSFSVRSGFKSALLVAAKRYR
jgi:hypothetical protein